MTTCTTCKFFHTIPFETAAGTKGENFFCRRYPPTLVNANQSAMVPANPAGWCGEFVPAPKKRGKA